MGRMGRPRHPDVLTPREWEVLALLRERLTNEQIASHLSITLDGAKYHVSQILSKLGVASREEAAAWRPYEEQRRSLWQRFILIPIAAKVVALAILLAAAAGIGVLGWSVLANGGPFAGDEGPARECTNLQGCAGLDFPTDGDNLFNFPSPPAGSTCQQVIDYVRQNVPREGRMAGGVRFYSTFSSDLGSGVAPDFVVDVISPLSRDDFLQRKKWSEEKFQNWLAPSGLRLNDFLLIYYSDTLKWELGRDPETGRLLTEQVSGVEQIGGDEQCLLGCSWKELVGPRACPTP